MNGSLEGGAPKLHYYTQTPEGQNDGRLDQQTVRGCVFVWKRQIDHTFYRFLRFWSKLSAGLGPKFYSVKCCWSPSSVMRGRRPPQTEVWENVWQVSGDVLGCASFRGICEKANYLSDSWCDFKCFVKNQMLHGISLNNEQCVALWQHRMWN